MVPMITPLLYITALNNHTFLSPQYSPEALRNGGLVLRFAMLRHQSPKLICDRELDKRKVCRCFVGSEAVDWLTKISPMVHGRFHAIAMLQALLEEGVITQGGGLIPKNTILVTRNKPKNAHSSIIFFSYQFLRLWKYIYYLKAFWWSVGNVLSELRNLKRPLEAYIYLQRDKAFA